MRLWNFIILAFIRNAPLIKRNKSKLKLKLEVGEYLNKCVGINFNCYQNVCCEGLYCEITTDHYGRPVNVCKNLNESI